MLLAGFPAIAAHLVAAEGYGGVHRLVAIDPDRTGTQRPGHLMRLADIGSPDARAETEGRRVGALDQLVTVLEGDRGDHGTEDFLLRDPHVVQHIGEHGRLHEIALGQCAFGQASAAGHGFGAFLLADGEIAGHALHLLLGDERADLRIRIEAIADLQLLAELGDAADEFVVDLALDEQARAGAADLPGIGEHRHRGARHGGIEIGVGKHDVGRLAAKLQRHALEIAGRGPDNRLARDVRAGKGDLVDVGMRGERRTGGLAIARHDVDDAGRHAGFHCKLGQPQRSEGRLFRRLEHHGAAGCDRRADLPDGGGQRAVPGNDRADDADGFLQRVGKDFAGQRVLDGLAMQRRGLACIIAQHAEHAQAIAAGTGDRCAHVEGVELRQLLEILLDEVGEPEQHALPLEWLHLAPRPLEGAARGGDRAVDVLGVALGDDGEQFAGGRIARLELLARRGIDPFAIDQHLLVGTIRIGMARDRNCLRDGHVCNSLLFLFDQCRGNVIFRSLQRPSVSVNGRNENLPCPFVHGAIRPEAGSYI